MLRGAVAALVALNLATLAWLFVFNKSGSQGPDKSPGQRIVQELGFTPEQTQAFNQELAEHQKEISEVEKHLREAKKDFFSNLKGTAITDSILQEAAKRIGELEAERDLITYRHMEEVEKICNPEQKIKFDDLVLDALSPVEKQGSQPK